MSLNVEKGKRKRIVIVGGGFGGLQVANGLKGTDYQVILIDKNNYHQFPPLIYQVASAGMEASSISFPFRRNFQKRKNFYFRMAELRAIYPEKKTSPNLNRKGGVRLFGACCWSHNQFFWK